MGQLGHLWKTSQWAVWMWDLMEFSPPNTTWQLEHLHTDHGVYHVEEGGTGVGGENVLISF